MTVAQILAKMEVPVLMDLIVINANVMMNIKVLTAKKVSTLKAHSFQLFFKGMARLGNVVGENVKFDILADNVAQFDHNVGQ